jgi:hypothetical protein
MATILAMLAGSLFFISGAAVAKQDPGKHSGGSSPKGESPAADHGKPPKDGDGQPPAASSGDPAGNNGTIKIDGLPFDDAPDNEPHPGCIFQLDFYGFDAGPLDADVSFEAIAPTAGGVVRTDVVPIGEDSHAGGGSEAGLDASRTYDLRSDLAGITPHPKQGWHIKVTVHADGSQGADVKHKVFWVQDCGVSSTGTSAQPSSLGGSVGSTIEVADTNAGVLAAGVSPAAGQPIATQVEGLSIERGSASASPLAGLLARTGTGLGLVGVALALIVAGGMLIFVRRRLGHASPPATF